MKFTRSPHLAAFLIVSAVVGAGAAVAAPAQAACSTSSGLEGIYYYMADNCASNSYLGKINGATQINNLASYGSGWNNSISSVVEGPADSHGSWRLTLADGINLSGSVLGLSNGSTTSGKYWNLSGLNFNDKASSLLQTKS